MIDIEKQFGTMTQAQRDVVTTVLFELLNHKEEIRTMTDDQQEAFGLVIAKCIYEAELTLEDGSDEQD